MLLVVVVWCLLAIAVALTVGRMIKNRDRRG